MGSFMEPVLPVTCTAECGRIDGVRYDELVPMRPGDLQVGVFAASALPRRSGVPSAT